MENDILHAKMYFNMPYALETAGGNVTIGSVDFEPHVIVDRELITGQNPRSDHPLAAKLVEAPSHISFHAANDCAAGVCDWFERRLRRPVNGRRRSARPQRDARERLSPFNAGSNPRELLTGSGTSRGQRLICTHRRRH